MGVITLRVTDETKEAVEKLLNTFEGSREEQLLAVLEELGKRNFVSMHPERSSEIREFCKEIDDLLKKYERSLAMAADVEVQTAAKLKKEMDKKDAEIAELRNDNKNLRAALANNQNILNLLTSLCRTENENSEILKSLNTQNRNGYNSNRRGTYYPELFDK